MDTLFHVVNFLKCVVTEVALTNQKLITTFYADAEHQSVVGLNVMKIGLADLPVEKS